MHDRLNAGQGLITVAPMFERIFRLREKHTSVRIEVLAGLITFLTMAALLLAYFLWSRAAIDG